MTEVWIVQPYVPTYRVPFFELLNRKLATFAINLHVVAGVPRGPQALRGDAESPDWLVNASDRTLRVGARALTLTTTRRHWRHADAVIVPHMGSSLDAITAVFATPGVRAGVWGHIRSYTSKGHPVDAAIERAQLRRADHVFAYTPGGADYARSVGVSPDRTTTVMNSIDTSELINDIDSISPEERISWRARHRLPQVPLVAYLGGLDASKRIDFLAQALDHLHADGSPIHLVVGGTGSDEAMLARAQARGQVTLMGRVDGRDKALILSEAIAIACPGRVGLVAVDGLAAHRPIITTDFEFHAPEVEYLEEGRTMFSSIDDAREYAQTLDRLVESPASEGQWSAPTLEAMVSNFSAGVRALVES